jgi:hypothetical protein
MTATRFEGSGPVARYWLARCEGFAVEGALRGTVEELLRDADPHAASRLLVRTRRGGRRVVPVAAVASVVPEERTLVLSQPRRHRPARRRRQLPDLRGPARAALPYAQRAGVETWRVARPAVLMLGESLRILGRELGASLRLPFRRR